jgi:hypothetical protein
MNQHVPIIAVSAHATDLGDSRQGGCLMFVCSSSSVRMTLRETLGELLTKVNQDE